MKVAQKNFDHAVQRAKRQYWTTQQTELLELCRSDSGSFWKKIGTIGVAKERNPRIPAEVLTDNGIITEDEEGYLRAWRDINFRLFNPNMDGGTEHVRIYNASAAYVEQLDMPITVDEIKSAMKSAKMGKAHGVDNIPAEVLINNECEKAMLLLFNQCFSSGIIPLQWKQGIMNPILKSRDSDPRDPNNYRCITLTCATYKMYCHIFLMRLQAWCDENDIVSDEQNGFRKDRSCAYQLLTLTNTVLTRKHGGNSVFACYVDFSNAYDRINRELLWSKLCNYGIGINYLTALRGIYNEVSGAVRVNGRLTDWFKIHSGLKQGCLLSPTLFNIYINDFITGIKSLNAGIKLDDGDYISILAYADDIVMMSPTPEGLQNMLDYLGQWCEQNCMEVKCSKTKAMHFRKASMNKTDVTFKLGMNEIEIVDSYKYLGLHLNEHMYWNYTAKKVAQAANRSLGLLIAKFKAYGGIPYTCFSTLYDALVDSIIRYGSGIWGYRSFSCISAVQNRASRFFLGVGKYTPNAAVQGDLGWSTSEYRQWMAVTRMWHRVNSLKHERINYKAHAWARRLSLAHVKNWTYHVCAFFRKLNLDVLLTPATLPSKGQTIQLVSTKVSETIEIKWQNDINAPNGRTANTGNKLRTYSTFKQQSGVEQYVLSNMSRTDRSALAKFRCGTAPIRIETGRYQQVPVDQRLCPFACAQVESEVHVLIDCHIYEALRSDVWRAARTHEPLFENFNSSQKLCTIMGFPDMRATGVLCKLILKRRRCFVYYTINNHKFYLI
jgi:hypothetical protein